MARVPPLTRARKVKVGDVTPYLLGTETMVEVTSTRGTHVTERHLVEDLSGDVRGRLFAAILSAGIPRVGDVHPLDSTIRVDRVVASMADARSSQTQAIVTVDYGFPSEAGNIFNQDPDDPAALPTTEVATTLQSATTFFATNRQPLVIRTPGEPPEGDEEGPPAPRKVLAGVDFQIPMTTFIYRRRERNNPQQKSLDFVQHIDGDDTVPGTGFIFGEPRKHHWLCTAISGSTDDGGDTYNVTYEFQRHPDTWDPIVVDIDPKTGRPPDDVDDLSRQDAPPALMPTGPRIADSRFTATGAIYRTQVYPQATFMGLQLTL